MTTSELEQEGEVFPPRDEWDVAAYPTDDVVAGYREHRSGDPAPGPNRPPGYRWGWANAEKDRTYLTKGNDGLESVRSAYIRMTRLAN